MLQDGADNRDVEFAEVGRQIVNVAVKNFRARAEQTVTKPVGVFPALDLGAILLGPAGVVAVGWLVFEWKKFLLGAIALVERNDSLRPALLRFETEEAGRRSDIENRLAAHVDAADVIVETPAQITMRRDQTKAKQFEREAKKTITQSLN